MAPPLFEIPCSVFLPGKLVLSQADIDYQWSHGGDFNCEGLNIFTITLMAVVTIAVFLRLWSRKIAKIEWKSDDYTLIAGWVRPRTSPIHLRSRSCKRAIHSARWTDRTLLSRYYRWLRKPVRSMSPIMEDYAATPMPTSPTSRDSNSLGRYASSTRPFPPHGLPHS